MQLSWSRHYMSNLDQEQACELCSVPECLLVLTVTENYQAFLDIKAADIFRMQATNEAYAMHFELI